MAEDISSTRPLAVVTGAARRLGFSLAEELAKLGYAVVLHFNHSALQAEEAADVLRAYNIQVYPLKADLTQPDEIDRLFERVAALQHTLKVLVNSAAVMPQGNIATLTTADWDNTMSLNLRAPMLCAQHAARLMGDEGGLIVNMSDAGAQRVWTGFPAYTVSKAGVDTLTRLLARSLAPKIRVNAIAPGLILQGEGVSEEDWHRLINRLPLKREGHAQDITQALRYLIENEYVTGQILAVDGGYQLV